MFLRFVGKKLSKLWVSIEGTNTLNYIAMVKFVGLASKCKLLPNKFWKSIRELPIDDPVELVGI